MGYGFTLSSDLSAPPVSVWRHAVSPDGVNREFRPLLRMTFPAGMADLTARWSPGKKLFRSWILVAGLLPVEYDDIVIEEVDPGRRFLERSAMLSQRVWEHERVIEARPGGCRITDRVCFEPRLPGTGAVSAPIFRRVFQWRHRNLRRLFDGAALPGA
jgi:ligand-binding SRPBCC domain-containing protein